MDECEEDIYYFGPPKSVREYTCIPKENYQQMQSKLSELEAENAALRAVLISMLQKERMCPKCYRSRIDSWSEIPHDSDCTIGIALGLSK